MKEIYEDKYYQEQPKKTLEELNTKEQRKRAQFYLNRYLARKAEVEEKETEWNELEKLYKCERDVIQDAPNSFIPLIAPIADGQIASMTEQNITSNVIGNRVSDQNFARDAQMAIDLFLRENNIRQRLKVGIKRYTLFGNFVIGIDYNPNLMSGFGLPTLKFLPLNRVFVDGNIKDLQDHQEAEYIIEECENTSIMWAREEFGDDVVDYLQTGSSDSKATDDEQYSFTMLKVWHHNNKKRKLQLMRMDTTGFVLSESSPKEHYWKYCDGKYPYVFSGLYHEEGEFYRFGDGKRLRFMQETLNKLYDEIITAIKYSSQGKKFIDPAGMCDPDEAADQDPSKPVLCKDPQQNIYVLQGSGIHPIVLQLVNQLVAEAQRAARFSALMSGNGTGEKLTATQAGLQVQQGNTNISDKKQDISTALAEACRYALEICMDKWESGIDVFEDDKKEKPYWLDVRKLAKVPVQIPVDDGFRKRFKEMHKDEPMPKFMGYTPSEDIVDDLGEIIAKAGEQQTRKADLTIEINIGEGLPTNKVALYNIILSLAQLQLPDESTGQLKPLLGYGQVKRMIEDLVGLPIDETLEDAKKFMSSNGLPVPQVPKVGPVNVNPNIPGANMNGNMSGAAGGGGIPA